MIRIPRSLRTFCTRRVGHIRCRSVRPRASSCAPWATERLLIRTAEVRDVDLIYELWTDPRVMANVGFPHGLRITREEIKETLRKPSDSEFERLLVVELKATGQAIGQCIMHHPNDEGLAETDIKLLPAFWGHKYGVEVKRGLVAHLFSYLPALPFLVVVLRHLRFFTEPIPGFVLLLESLDSIM